MKKWFALLGLLLFPLCLQAQFVLNDFDTILDPAYFTVYDGGAKTYLDLTQDTNVKHAGPASLRIAWQNRSSTADGGWIGLQRIHPTADGVFDFSPYTDVSFWYYIEKPCSKPGHVDFRFILYDMGDGTSVVAQEIWLSHSTILDDTPGWKRLVIPLKDVGGVMPGTGEGFWNPRWGQSATGNKVLDLDRIRAWSFEFSMDGTFYQAANDTADGVIYLDDVQLEGAAPLNLVMFNGKSIPAGVNMHIGWSGSAALSEEEDYTGGTRSIKWVTESGWDGVNFDFENPKNMVFNWAKDTLQFKIKAPAGLGDLTVGFTDTDEDGAAKADYNFPASIVVRESEVGFNGTWKQVRIPLRKLNRYAGVWDNDLNASVPGMFDSTRVHSFFITGAGQAFGGTSVYLDDIWTGSPVFDWVPPAMVTGVAALPADKYNLVIWEDLASELGETYSVYASAKPITDVKAPGVELVAKDVVENTQTAVHWLTYPLKDTKVTWYYAVQATDANGNDGPIGTSGAITNTALGVATVSLHPPATFVADGNLSEWETAGVMPWVLKPSVNNVSVGQFSSDEDLTASVYLAMDDTYLYVAADVLDNVYAFSNTQGNWWNWDAFEMYIGFYDQHGAMHQGPQRGAEPDYKLVFKQDILYHEYSGSDFFYKNGDPDYFFSSLGTSDYILEARLPLDAIVVGGDTRFHPQRGMRIPIEFVFHDNDGTTSGDWQGNLTLSDKDTDYAWQTVEEWTTTWIGDTTAVATAVERDPDAALVSSYTLGQNYPNPFNPVTEIHYAIAAPGRVHVALYNALGQQVRSLVDEYKPAGQYQIKVMAGDLTSGVYFYRIQCNEFSQVRKMVLMK